MTKHEFASKYRIVKRKQTRRLAIVSVVPVVTFFWIALGAKSTINYIGQQDWIASLPSYWFIAAVGLIAIAIGFATLFITEPHAVLCPHCEKKLVGTSVSLAVFTGNCAYCGENIIEDNIVASAAPPPKPKAL